MPPRRWKGTSRRPPIGWLQRGSGVRRPRVPSGLLEPRPLCRSTSRPASVRETRRAVARGRVRGRRTPPVAGSSRRCRASGGRALGFSERHHASIIEFENFSSVNASRRRRTPASINASTWVFTFSTPASAKTSGAVVAPPAPRVASSSTATLLTGANVSATRHASEFLHQVSHPCRPFRMCPSDALQRFYDCNIDRIL
jgi:hypothetical protein